MTAISYPTETSARAYPFSASDVADLQASLEHQRAADKPYGLDDLESLVSKLPTDGGEVWLESIFELIAVPGAGRNFPAGDPAALRLEALWERHLAVRDERLAENPAGVNELRWLMSDITEITDWASWTHNTPYTCWALLEGTSSKAVPAEQVLKLRELVAETGGIWTWPGDEFTGVDWQAPGPLFVPLAEWQEHQARESWEEKVADQVRWTEEAFGVGPDQCRLNDHVRPRA